MHGDPILREVHRMKYQFACEMEYDLDKMFERFRENEQKNPERVVKRLPGTGTQNKSKAADCATVK